MKIPNSLIDLLCPGWGTDVVYIHAPKCGGSFLRAAFGRRRYDRCPTQRWPEAQGHLTYLEYRPLFTARGLDLERIRTFSVVRNPWAWHVSWYHFIKGDSGARVSGHLLEHELFQSLTFSEYLAWLDDPTAARSPQGYLVRQISDWIVDEDGRIAVDDVLHQETLEEDLADLIRRLGLRVRVPRIRVNASEHGDFRSYYTDGDAERIAARHRRDTKLLGYDFDG